jgi:DNA mismatch endonuclease (patch repair protein)
MNGSRALKPETSSWATTPGTRRSMQQNRPRDTSIEVHLRSALHRAGLRFFKHRRPLPGLRCEPDILFPGARLAVFVDGCFWHCCPDHGTVPKANGEWWRTKLEANQVRDERNNDALRAAGWTVLRVWEHQPVHEVVDEIRRLIGAPARASSPANSQAGPSISVN